MSLQALAGFFDRFFDSVHVLSFQLEVLVLFDA
jgi:hypothetical protein